MTGSLHPAAYALARPHLGTMPDHVLAQEVGVCTNTVRLWREDALIAPYRLHARPCRHAKGAAVYLAVLRQAPQGLTQGQVAQRVGVTKQAAHQMLQRLVHYGHVTTTTRHRSDGEPCWHEQVTVYAVRSTP